MLDPQQVFLDGTPGFRRHRSVLAGGGPPQSLVEFDGNLEVERPHAVGIIIHTTLIPHLNLTGATLTPPALQRGYGFRMAEGVGRDEARGDRIRDLVQNGHWSATHLAREVGVDRTRIYDWMKGGAISSTNASELATALGTSRTYLLSGESPDPLAAGGDAAVRQLLEKMTEQQARQVEMQADLARLSLAVEGLREDLRSLRAPGGRVQGGRG